MSLTLKHINENSKDFSFSVDDLAETLRGCSDCIEFAFLLGSSKNGTVKAYSDLDLAFYLNKPADINFYNNINETVEKILPDVRADISILNNAEPVFCFEVLKGKLLFVNDQEKYLRFYSLTCRLYESQMIDYEKQHKYRMEVLNG